MLGRAERYPVGSIVRYGPEDLDPGTEPFFLVRAPGGFYAVYGTGDFGDRGYDGCRLRFDRAAREFWCANGARWDIVGEVVRKPRADAPVDDLALLRGKVSIDGYVLVGGWGIGPRHGYWPAPAA